MQNWQDTLISQYANSPTIIRLIEGFNSWVDPSADFEQFYSFVWNLSTAKGYGLDVWGRIVAVQRVLPVPASGVFFGFKNVANNWAPMSQAPFFNGKSVTSNYRLPDEAYRTLIFTKAAFNISASDSASINAILGLLFAGRGRAYVNDYGKMTMRYTFEFYLTPVEASIFANSGAIPKPAGVMLNMVQEPPQANFGFFTADKRDYAPFGQAPMLYGSGNLVA